jgi:hypothetical protein
LAQITKSNAEWGKPVGVRRSLWNIFLGQNPYALAPERKLHFPHLQCCCVMGLTFVQRSGMGEQPNPDAHLPQRQQGAFESS